MKTIITSLAVLAMAANLYAAEATYVTTGRTVDYTPAVSGGVAAGEVVVQNDLVGVAAQAIASNKLGALTVEGVFDVQQAAEIITAGKPVYWDADGNSVSGTAGTGAATATPTGNTFMGFALKTSAAADSTVQIVLRSVDSSDTGYIAGTNAQTRVGVLESAVVATTLTGNIAVARLTNAMVSGTAFVTNDVIVSGNTTNRWILTPVGGTYVVKSITGL
jgi:predicted RecA/RadA family phage recombinase